MKPANCLLIPGDSGSNLPSRYTPKLFGDGDNVSQKDPGKKMSRWLVVLTHLKNMKVSWDYIFPIYGKIKFMFQTTNQLESDLQAATVLADKALRLSVGKNRTAMFGPWGLPRVV